MQVEIDQSGKVGDSSIDTVLAFSNGTNYSVRITKNTKRKVIKELREKKKGTVFYFELFAVLVFLLISKFYKEIYSYHIDQEYKGREQQIKLYLIHAAKKSGITLLPQSIHFVHIGKKSKAHRFALTALQNKKANMTISYEDIMHFFTNKKDRGSKR